jgi:fructose-bisphosphate aldolase class I
VLADGEPGDHGIDRCQEVTEETLDLVFSELRLSGVDLSGMLLKPNMVLPGIRSKEQPSVEEVARRTVETLRRTVPAVVPGIAFLSGGQSDGDATAHLSAMNRMAGLPWKLTFSYGRALQHAALVAWGGEARNVPAAQRAFTHRAKMNALAARGEWTPELDRQAA